MSCMELSSVLYKSPNKSDIVRSDFNKILDEKLKSVLLELGCDLSGVTSIMDYPDIIKNQLISKYYEHDTIVTDKDIDDNAFILLKLNNEKCKISIGDFKKYLWPNNEEPEPEPYIDSDNTIILPDNVLTGEYTLIYEDINNNQLSNYDIIGKITI